MGQESNNQSSGEEKQRKVLVLILIVILLAGGVFYATRHPKDNKKSTVVVSNNKTQAKVLVSSSSSVKNTEKRITDKPKKQAKVEDKDQPVQLIKATDRTSLVRIAMLQAGKSDPFSGTAQPVDIKADLTPQKLKSISVVPIKYGSIPAPPGLKLPLVSDSFKNISNIMGKTIKDLPNIGLPGNFKRLMQPVVDFDIKGFIGNKVIISINGNEDAVSEGQTYRGIKIVEVSPESMSAVFKVNNQNVTKSIKSLTDISHRNDVKLTNHK